MDKCEEGGLEKMGARGTARDTLTVKVLGEEDSAVCGHRATPARVVNVVTGAIDAAILGHLVARHAMRRGAGFTERGALQTQTRYVMGALVLVQPESTRKFISIVSLCKVL
jgi:hypothetical protein